MKYQYKIFSTILVQIFIVLNLFGSVTSNLAYNLTWNDIPKQKLLNDKTIYEYIDFIDAQINNENLPFFYKKIKINREIADVSLTEVQFEIISDEQLVYYKTGKINDTLNLKYYINSSSLEDYLNLELVPLRYNASTGNYERIKSFTIKVTFLKDPSLKLSNLNKYPANSILSNGKCYKISVSKTAMYYLSYNDLKNMGFSNPDQVGLFGIEGGMLPEINDGSTLTDPVEIPVLKIKGSDGIFNNGDYIVFYLKGPDKWFYNNTTQLFEHEKHDYSYSTCYFISDNNPSREPEYQKSPVSPANVTVTWFNDFAFHELDTINPIQTGREWYGEKFMNYKLSHNFDFNFSNIKKDEPVIVSAVVLSRSDKTRSFVLYGNNNNLGTFQISSVIISDYTKTFARDKHIEGSFLSNSNDINIKLSYLSENSYDSEGYLDYIRVNVKRNLIMAGNQMDFRNTSTIDSGNVSKFIISNSSSDLMVWDITDFYNTKIINGSWNSDNYIFDISTDTLKEFIAFYPSKLIKPKFNGSGTGMIENQNLHGQEAPDYLIITNKKFTDYANKLAEIHKNKSDLNVLVVEQNKIFNEFSSGTKDVVALRNFAKMFYDKSGKTKPRYILLFGDGTYDNKHSDPNNYNYILTYQSKNSLTPTSSYVTDDYYGLLDDNEDVINGSLDVGIGRFPVHDTAGASVMIRKVESYLSAENFGDWKNTLCFVGDDEDYNLHMTQANNLSIQVDNSNPSFNKNKIFLDAYKQISSATGSRYPDVNTAIYNQLKKGTLIFNYTGHGAEFGLAHEKILSDTDINYWDNWGKFPLFMTATCEFSRFDYVKFSGGVFTSYKTTGENVVLHKNGGAIASFTTTRIVYASANFQLNENFYKYVFKKNETYNERNRLGDIMRLSKNATSSGINKRNFSLLGDPALTLSYPKHKIIIDSINGKATNVMTDTLGAYSFVTINGHIEYETGGFFNDFNGLLYATIYDKYENINTLNNDGHGVFKFKLQNNILFKGKASVTNGIFEFSFLLPKDIAIRKGKGKISCYAYNGIVDASGYDTSIIIGGVETSSEIYDDVGPEINLFMNDEYYRENGITNESPTLLALLSDESGINTATSGIGHEITAFIDHDYFNPIVMNDFYVSETDDYKNGKVEYPLLNLEPGEHTISLKVWDILNNSNEAEMNFFVHESNKLKLQNVYNNPNPLTTYTDFVIEHNLSGENLDITINIYSMSGQLIFSINKTGTYNGFMTPVYRWDGRSVSGSYVKNGLYFYKIIISSEKGSSEKSSKILIVR